MHIVRAKEQMMEYTYSDELYSDFHKDTYGVRPGETGFRYWNSLTPDEKQAEWEQMGETMRAEQEWEKQQQERAVVDFEQHVLNTIATGARDRATALRWIMDASSADGDWDYFCYQNGLPYGYFKEAA